MKILYKMSINIHSLLKKKVGALHATPRQLADIKIRYYFPYLIEAWEAASLAIGTLKGEQLT